MISRAKSKKPVARWFLLLLGYAAFSGWAILIAFIAQLLVFPDFPANAALLNAALIVAVMLAGGGTGGLIFIVRYERRLKRKEHEEKVGKP